MIEWTKFGWTAHSGADGVINKCTKSYKVLEKRGQRALGPVHTDAYSSNTKQNLSVFTSRPHGYAENDGIVFTEYGTI